MLTVTEKATLRKKLGEYEGCIPYMYRDTKGYVTVGVGHMIPNVVAAQKLDFVTSTGQKASAEEIKADYDAVKAHTKGLKASNYKSKTKLILKQADIDALTNKHIASFESELKNIYLEFDKFPSEVRLALFDMIFNLGMPKLKNNWPTFDSAIKAEDWKKAAENSNRIGIQLTRNKYVKDLLLTASKATKK
jgi:GH24 family phage-related lysozyme (muramidase)